jgi:hypothetical protein
MLQAHAQPWQGEESSMFRSETQAILSRLAQRGTGALPGTLAGTGPFCPRSAPYFGLARRDASRLGRFRHRTTLRVMTHRRASDETSRGRQSMKVLYTARRTTPGPSSSRDTRGVIRKRHWAQVGHEIRSYSNATRGNMDVRLSRALRHLGRKAMQGTSRINSTHRIHARQDGRRRVCIPASRHRCAEFDRQSSEMSRGSGGCGWLLGLSVLRGPSGPRLLASSARPEYSPVRRSTGAFRPQVQYFLGFAGHHPGVRADP